MEMNPELTHLATTQYFWPSVEMWCVENIGGWNTDWYRIHADMAQFIDNNGPVYDTYYFRTSEQAMLFALRWA